ncbi:acetylglutamate kinase [Enterococcus alcedinis]|uniref:Acetylglutamate kinase n=1 Tax=Enterococcus alcedinis TaxID=1274384 RepID=A0A917JFV1_9ENTE|nr:acetylglutamate kinase [Enterococcus alcedinis]GGI66503.1 acetylglutamate kinase [Enterococcus alcedinis]
MVSDELRAEILMDALPYIQKYNNKIVVVKYGGNAMTSETLKDAVMADIVLLSLIGIKVVLVHGGGPEINEHLQKIGKESRFVDGLRYTDQETMDVVQMVLAGKVNKNLVAHLEKSGGKAIGLCGIDGSMLQAEKKASAVDLGFVGTVTNVDATPILNALDQGYIPVVSTIGIGTDKQTYNINADTAAAKIAATLQAENLILMSDIKGVLRDYTDENTLIPLVQVSEVPSLVKQGIISGGMIPKIECCVEAIRRGVKRSIIIDGRTPHSILIELLSKDGIGTMFS